MPQPLSIENKDEICFITTRTAESRLLMLNNKPLEEAILGALARYTTRYEASYEAIIYGFIIMGNHYYLIAKFPKENRAIFMRDFNSAPNFILTQSK